MGPVKHWLVFTSASGTTVWELDPPMDFFKLDKLAYVYNGQTSRRGEDGNAEVTDDEAQVLSYAEGCDSLEEMKATIEGWGSASFEQAVDMLTGKKDGLTGQ